MKPAAFRPRWLRLPPNNLQGRQGNIPLGSVNHLELLCFPTRRQIWNPGPFSQAVFFHMCTWITRVLPCLLSVLETRVLKLTFGIVASFGRRPRKPKPSRALPALKLRACRTAATSEGPEPGPWHRVDCGPGIPGLRPSFLCVCIYIY